MSDTPRTDELAKFGIDTSETGRTHAQLTWQAERIAYLEAELNAAREELDQLKRAALKITTPQTLEFVAQKER
jgi:hypothetical protein